MAYTDEKLKEVEAELFQGYVLDDGILESYLHGHKSRTELADRLEYFRDRAIANAPDEIRREMEDAFETRTA